MVSREDANDRRAVHRVVLARAMAICWMVSGVAFLVVGCSTGSDDFETQWYASQQQCRDKNEVPDEKCDEAFQSAQAFHATNGPRFLDEKDCLEAFKGSKCFAVRDRGEVAYLPEISGFFVGEQSFNPELAEKGGYRDDHDTFIFWSQPTYFSGGGHYTRSESPVRFAPNSNKAVVSNSAVRLPPSTVSTRSLAVPRASGTTGSRGTFGKSFSSVHGSSFHGG